MSIEKRAQREGERAKVERKAPRFSVGITSRLTFQMIVKILFIFFLYG